MDILILLLQQTLILSVPLLLVALGGMVSERSGVANIGLEGIMVMGALAGVAVLHVFGTETSGQGLFIVSLLAAAVAGGIYSMVHAYVAIDVMADQTISGTALNLFAPAFAVFLLQSITGLRLLPFKDNFMISCVPVLGKIPFIGKVLFCNCYLTTFIGIVILLALVFIFKKTRVGLRLCACGEKPRAVALAGISVRKYRYLSVLVSGILGGIGGMAFVVPTSIQFSGSVSGYGFLALAVVIFGKWKPVPILCGALFFGFMKAVSSIYSSIPLLAGLPIPAEFYRMIPYIFTLIILAFSSKNSAAPKAVGVPYSIDGE